MIYFYRVVVYPDHKPGSPAELELFCANMREVYSVIFSLARRTYYKEGARIVLCRAGLLSISKTGIVGLLSDVDRFYLNCAWTLQGAEWKREQINLKGEGFDIPPIEEKQNV